MEKGATERRDLLQNEKDRSAGAGYADSSAILLGRERTYSLKQQLYQAPGTTDPA